MKTFKVYSKQTEKWDGSEATAKAFGYGDYTKTRHVEVATIEATGVRAAQAQARKIFSEQNLGKAIFSGVGYTAMIEQS